MNSGAGGGAALRAAIAVARGCEPAGGQVCANPAAGFAADVGGLDAAALGLLWRVRQALADPAGAAGAPAVVQFVPCGFGAPNSGGVGAVALGFGRAAAALWGRSLLVVAGSGAAPAGVLPDAFVPRLYHQALGRAALYSLLSRPDAAAGPGGGMFNVVVIDQAARDAGECASVTAPLCSATILVAQAGRSDLASINAAIGRIGCAGGRVLGTVLAGVPAWVRA